MNNGSQWMVGGERIQFGVEVHIRGIDPDPGAIRVGDIHIRMKLCDGNCQGGTSVDHGMFPKENDLGRCGRLGHK
jgi:hypothetical protein